jgi:radical SAM protein with 4Fe4S-binding SPASM domain
MIDTRRCTYDKILNYLAARMSRGRDRAARGMPTRLVIEPSSICNLKCAICPHGRGDLKRAKVIMPFDMYRTVTDEAARYLFGITFAGMGEPLLNPDLARMIAHAHGRGIYTQVFTNLLPLNRPAAEGLVRAGLDRIIISLDSATPETYSKMKSLDGFDRLTANWALLRSCRADLKKSLPRISVSFVATKYNKDEIPEAEKIARRIGCEEFFVKSVNLCNAGQGPASFSSSDLPVAGHNRYDFNKAGRNARPLCPWVWNSSMIYANGDVGPCCFDTAAENVLGNITRHTLGEIWNGRAFQDFRAAAIRDLNSIPICKACTSKYGRSKT